MGNRGVSNNGEQLNFRNLHELVRDTMLLAPALRDVDVIVGVPRSGMIPAAILATALHKPMGRVDYADPEDVWILEILGGARLKIDPTATGLTVAVVDDSVFTGAAMREDGDILADGSVREVTRCVRCCVYVHPEAVDKVDHYAVVVPPPRVFQWNLFGCPLIRHCMLDIDGVLCPDAPFEDDRETYERFITAAPVLHKPLYPVAALATNRLERYREMTEAWLALHGIEYGELFMAPFDTPDARRRMSTPAELKSAWYSQHTDEGILIESHDRLAAQVAANVGRPVVSVQSWAVFQ